MDDPSLIFDCPPGRVFAAPEESSRGGRNTVRYIGTHFAQGDISLAGMGLDKDGETGYHHGK